VIGIVVAATGGYGVFLLVTSAAGWRGIGLRHAAPMRRRRTVDLPDALGAGARDLVALLTVCGTVSGLFGLALFGAPAAGLVMLVAGLGAPVSVLRGRRRAHAEQVAQAWPAMLEELRMQTSSLGRSIPLALLDVGSRSATPSMRAAFAAANRHWLLSNDFAPTVAILKSELRSATADMVLETLLVAYEVGGSELDRRLEALIEDRSQDLASRRDARSRQAGVRFARWFTVAVPLGMALVGVSIGDGRAAYRTGGGQLAIAVAVAMTALCWWWAGITMRLPEQERVFVR
jgi:tight adherence protein B